jgi:hypothetical protein
MQARVQGFVLLKVIQSSKYFMYDPKGSSPCGVHQCVSNWVLNQKHTNLRDIICILYIIQYSNFRYMPFYLFLKLFV